MTDRELLPDVEADLDRILTRLRGLIRERGFTHVEVQEALGWGRAYIRKLLAKQKPLRFEQLFEILNVIGVDPADFFGEIFPFGEIRGMKRRQGARP